jgi:hypothetical protein
MLMSKADEHSKNDKLSKDDEYKPLKTAKKIIIEETQEKKAE